MSFGTLRFKEGREDVNDDALPGLPGMAIAAESIETVKKIILGNHRIIIREVTNDVGISFGSCQAIFSEVVGMKRAAAKIVLQLLNFE